MLRSWLLVGILGLCPALSLAQDVRPAAKLPVVKSGDMPFYPPLLRTAQVEGEVDLRVTTDGSSVVSATSDYGNLLLVKAAQDNVRTWKFEPREPTSFSTVFSYHLVKELHHSLLRRRHTRQRHSHSEASRRGRHHIPP